MTLHALLIVLVANTTGFADHISWHDSADACRAQAAIETVHLEMTGRPVAAVRCVSVPAGRIPRHG